MEIAPSIGDRIQSQIDHEYDSISKNLVTIVLPVLNEEQAIGPVINELRQEGYDNILVVDGYSTDNTPDVLRSLGIRTVQQHGKGKTGAIRTAIEHVVTPYILVMDADYTYSAGDIARFLSHAHNYSEVLGARKGSKDSFVASHKIGNRVITSVFNFLMGTNLSDILTGMYMLKTEDARQLHFHTSGFNVEVEIASQFAQEGGVTEVPIRYRERIGKQKLSTWRDGLSITSSIFRLARDYNPAFLFSILAGLLAIPGIAILGWVFVERYAIGVMHIGWAIAGAVLLLFAAISVSAGALSLLMKRMEARLTRRIRDR
jgi:dolichol-phosphate hexosyltransferase